MDGWRLFYKRSSASIHGNPRGFHRLGLPKNQQYKTLLTGPSYYGLETPLASTAISLMHISTSLIKLEDDYAGMKGYKCNDGTGNRNK